VLLVPEDPASPMMAMRISMWLMLAATTLVVIQAFVDIAQGVARLEPAPQPTVVSGYSVDAGSA
jgi:hypothetical protein